LGSASATNAYLAWNASSDNLAVVGYGLYVNGSKVGTIASTSYAFSGLACGSAYTLAVDAYDAAGNRSALASVQASTAACASTLGRALPAPLPPSTGQAFYVSPTGSDSASGTLSAPWQTIQKAYNSLLPGQTAFARAGTYPEWAALTRSGTATAPITLRAYPGERPVLTGRLKLSGSYARISGFLFQGRTAANATGVLVYVSGGDYDELSGNELRDSAMSAIYVGDPGNDAYHLFIIGNYIHDNGTHSNLDHGIYFGSGSDGLIANNVIEHNLAQGIKLAPAAEGTIATTNTVVRNGASGILVGGDTVDTSNNNLIVNNITAFNTGWGVRSYWESAGVGTGNQATRNLVYGNGSGVSWFPGGGLTLSDSLLANPLFANLSGGDLYLTTGSPALDTALPDYTSPTAYNGPRGPPPDLGALDG
jgi:parallel beta-helix repeat protein